MITRFVFTAVLCLGVSSCDRAKDFASKAKAAVAEQVEEVAGNVFESEEIPDSKFQGLVDQTSEGYLFRKDLPFPSHLKLKVKTTKKFKGRHFQSSLFGEGAGFIDGMFEFEREIERQGDEVFVKISTNLFRPAEVEGGEEIRKNVTTLVPSSSFSIERKGSEWSAKTSRTIDFASAGLMGVNFGQTLAEEGVLPRTFWFGKRRLKIGDEVTLTGDHLKLIFPGAAKGRILLKFEAIEPFEGHPCGVFAISGDIDSAQVSGLDGRLSKDQITIQSGQLWLSLVYPIILKEDLRSIVTSKEGEGKGEASRTQGSAHVKTERRWKPVQAVKSRSAGSEGI